MLSTPELAEALRRCKLLKIFADAAEEEAIKRLKAGTEMPGWGLFNGNSRRTWANTEEALKAIAAGEGIKVAQLWDKVPLSPAQVEGVIGKKNLAKYLNLVTWSEPPPRLGPADSKKAKYDPTLSAAEDFADIPVPDGSLPF